MTLQTERLLRSDIGDAEQLLADAQHRVSAYPELDDLQEIMVRVSAQVHGRRVEHDLVCEELEFAERFDQPGSRAGGAWTLSGSGRCR